MIEIFRVRNEAEIKKRIARKQKRNREKGKDDEVGDL